MTPAVRLPALLALALVARAHVAIAACSVSSLEERMSYKEFTAYGLDHLSAEQLRGLNDWLRSHGSADACAADSATRVAPAPEMQAPPAGAVSERAGSSASRIAGDFTGWHQGSIIALQNGQRWEVRDDEPFMTAREQQPRVTLRRGFLDGWELSVEGHVEIAHVLPVKAR